MRICPNCSEKNNPEFNECWKCHYSFLTNSIATKPNLEEIKEAMQDSSRKFFRVQIAGINTIKNSEDFATFVAQKSGWDIERTRSFLAGNAQINFPRMSVLQAEDYIEELQKIGVNASIVNDLENYYNRYKNDKSIIYMSVIRQSCVGCGSSKAMGCRPIYFWDVILFVLCFGLIVVLMLAFRPYKCICPHCGSQWDKA